MGKFLVIGRDGMLGADVCLELQRRSIEFVAPPMADLDITNPESIAKAFSETEYTGCINCAAYTAVDLAESEVDSAYAINAVGVGYLAQICQMANCRLIHVSTDFVFDGTASEPIPEDAPTSPLGVYGESKRAGEKSARSCGATVVRTSWLFGPHGKSFPRTILNAYRAWKTLRVVSDQVGCPTYTVDLARVLVDLATSPQTLPSVLHAVGPEIMSWHEFAVQTISSAEKRDCRSEIEPVSTDKYPTAAKRPAYSALRMDRLPELGISPMRPLLITLPEFLTRISSNG